MVGRYSKSLWRRGLPSGLNDKTEPGLIRWLEKKKKEGADFNAIRHFGTLLDHALRSHLERTALWLLENGGLSYKDGTGGGALALALHYGDATVADVLRKQAAITKQNAIEPDYLAGLKFTAITDGHIDSRPSKNPEPPKICLLDYLLNHNRILQAMELIQNEPKPFDNRNSAQCRKRYSVYEVAGNNAPRNAVSDEQIARLDTYLAQPVFFNLLFTCVDASCIDRLFKLKIRRPFDDADFTLRVLNTLILDRSYWETQESLNEYQAVLDHIPPVALQKILNDPKTVSQLIQTFYASAHYPGNGDEIFFDNRHRRSQTLAEPLLKKIPVAVLNQALDDDETLRRWFAWTSTNPSDLFKLSLQAVSSDTLRGHVHAVFKGMLTKAKVDFAEGKINGPNPIARANWLLLLERLPKTLDFAQSPPLLSKTEPDLWPRFFAMGYKIHDVDADLSVWLSRSGLDQVKQHWASLSALSPDLQQAGIRLALKPYTLGVLDDACHYAWTSLQENDLHKVQFLVQQGVNAPLLSLSPQCMRTSPAAIIQQLVSLRAIKSFKEAEKQRFVPERIGCSFTFNATWYRALVNDRVIHTEEPVFDVYADSVQLVELPGERECVLLVSGSTRVESYQGGPHDGFDGPSADPVPSCPDPTDRSAVWRQAAGKIEKISVDAVMGNLFALRDSVDGHLYYLRLNDSGRCSSPWANLMDWQHINHQWVLKDLAGRHPAQQAFIQQCDPAKAEVCLGIKSPGNETTDVETTQRLRQNPDSWQTLINFINTHQTAEHKTYLDAVMNLDKSKLKTWVAQSVRPEWTMEALQAINASSLPLADKRQRIAWLLREPDAIANVLSSDILLNFVDWLPREDWSPVFKALQGSFIFGELRKKAEEKGLAALACDFDHAMGLMCGETWSVEADQ